MAVPVPQIHNNAPVTLGLVASAAANVAIAFAKAKYGIDFAGQEGNITVLAMGAGYLISGQGLTQ